jgi:hypothetical protein
VFSRQFDNRGSDEDKAALIDQLSKSFHDEDLAWLRSPNIHVERTSVDPSQIDWDHRDEWAATHEPKEVKKKRKDIKKGNDKPVALVERPHKGPDDLFIMDGHHHAEAYTQLDMDIPAYKISVPKTNGPWDTLHSKQEHNKNA